MEYPSFIPDFFKCITPVDLSSMYLFVKFISNAHVTDDEIFVPQSFMRICASRIPEWVTYVLKNHFRFGGHFDFLGRSLSLTFRYPFYFEVHVMPSHMLKYCPGVKVPSEVSAFVSSLGLYNIGLYVPLKNTWLRRFVRVSETVEGIESLLKAYRVNPCYIFLFEYIGGSEFKVEIFNEYAVEVDYKNTLLCLEENDQHSENRGSRSKSIFGTSELQKDKLQSTFSYNACSYFDGELEFVIDSKHLEGNKMTEVISIDEAAGFGVDEETEWIKLGFKKYVWKIKLHWKRNRLLFGSQWNRFATASELRNGDKCILVGTADEERFEVAIFHKEQFHAVYKSGSVDGKGQLKWFKMLNWISIHTGEVEVPKMFVEKYGDDIADNAEIYMDDGMVYSCYFSKNNKLLFGLKKLMIDYGVKEHFTIFFDYVGKSKFYGSIFNKDGLEIFYSEQEKLKSNNLVKSTAPEVYMISDSDSDEDNAYVDTLARTSASQQQLTSEGLRLTLGDLICGKSCNSILLTYVVPTHKPVIASDAFVTAVETATEEFTSIFKNIKKRQSELINQAVLLNERYGNIADLVDERKRPKIGEMSSIYQTLPLSYSKSTNRFLHDSDSSLQKHTDKMNKAVENLINNFNESVEAWSKKHEELKEQTNVLGNNRGQYLVKVSEFKSVLYGYIPGIDSSDIDDSS
ncbi:hypothetical protein DCAR_0934628 [Daucus carota subsp. sativus]|uniref:TF-B3 domain-containing protein n=1 Tax=Daucus carota subsp. sativus TaxID=79200 RepID=A0A175YF83_DAUCS|nr:hypothetical protein DCAR_0934628 [Daucus carota subsp. sativus]